MPTSPSFNRLMLSLLLMAALPAAAQLPQPFRATYQAEIKGFSVSAQRALKVRKDGLLELSFSARSLFAQIDESSQFNWLKDGQLQPQHYEYHRTGLGRDRHAKLSFDWPALTVTNDVQDKAWKMALPEQAQDKLSYQLQLRHDLINQHTDMRYDVADGGKLKSYGFEVLGEEVLSTPLGQLNTVKVKRLRAHSDRQTLIWLALDWDHLIVRIQHIAKDGKDYEIRLSEAQVNGRSVKGL